MAASESPTRDEGRPPDTPMFGRKLSISKNFGKYSYVTKSVPKDSFLHDNNDESYIGFTGLLEDNIRLVQDVNKNNLTDSSTMNSNKLDKTIIKPDRALLKHGFPKILCLKKSSTTNLEEKLERNALNTLNVNSLESLSDTRINGCKNDKSASKSSLDNKTDITTASTEKPRTEPDYSNNYYSEKPKNRNSFHQNVEEALSSLLWQPYEYQNQDSNDYCFVSNGNGNYDYESYSTCSYTPSSSPISLDLDDPCDNVASSPSNTKNIIPSSTFLQCTAVPLQRRDLHSDVINLNRQEVSTQSATRIPSRDRLLQRSGTAAFVSLPSLASSNLDPLSRSVPEYELVTSCTEGFSGNSSMQSGSNGTGNQKSVPVSNLSASTSDNGLKNTSINVDTSLNAANIVGLPSSHSRYASVPCSSTSASFHNAHAGTRSQNSGGTVYPQHFRNFSEPSEQILRYSNNNNNASAVPSVHQKPHIGTAGTSTSNSQIDQHNLQLINHFRSSSVPKSMTLIPKYDVTTSSGPANSLRVKGAQVLAHNGNNLGHTGSISNNGTINNNSARLTNNRPTVLPSNISVSTQNINQENVHNVRPSPLKLLSAAAPTSAFTSSPGTANVSNVNVNFYRAVPVNVVSSVPTIHCLNTLSNDQGNSVSNVQVLPLGSSNQQAVLHNKNIITDPQLSVANSVTNVENQRLSNACDTNGTQVTVRNINAIHIGNSINSTNQIIASTVGFPEQNYRSHVTNTTNGCNFGCNIIQGVGVNARCSAGLPVSVAQVQEVNRNVLLHNVSTSTYTGGIATSFLTPAPVTTAEIPVNNISNVINVQNNARQSEVPYQLAGRIITTTAQINSSPLEQAHLGTVVIPQTQNATSGGTSIVRTRTFTSTEAQTDEILPAAQTVATQHQSAVIREQRRRERRERRQNRRNHGHGNASRSTNDSSTQSGGNSAHNPGQTTNAGAYHQAQNGQENRLPDILNSHLPPPYSTLPGNQNISMIPPIPPQILPPPPQIVPGAMLPSPHGPVLQTVVPNGVPASAFVFPAPQQISPLMQGGAPVPVAVPATGASGFRFGFPANGFRRSRFSEDSPKGCCGFLSWKPGSLRWFIALIALVAVCCVLVGTALGAMRPAGRDHLTVSLLMIGVGIVLITVSGVAWRLTSHDSSTCRSMLGLGSTESVDVCTRRFVPRLPPSYGRPHHPYAAMMYPEFQYRPPPPSYQASMQEYRLRLLLLDRGNTPQIQAGIQNAVSPPPTYRSHAGSLLRVPLSSRRDNYQSEYSCPPSYRSQNSSNRPGTLQGSILHSRDPSLTMSDSNQESVVNVVNILGSTEEDIALDNITLDSLKMEPESADINPLKMLLKGSHGDLEGSKDGNLVTIVQTSDQNPVIVTVSGCSHDNNSTVQITEIPSEMEILAHL